MKAGEILSLVTDILGLISNGIKQLKFPINDSVHSKGCKVDGKGWILKFNTNSLDILHNFIFNDVEYNQ